MSDLVDALDDSILVEYRRFGIMDTDVENTPNPFPGGPISREVVSVQQNRIDIRSAANDHVAEVRFEFWRRRPHGEIGKDWEDLGEKKLRLSSGELQLWSVTMGPSPNLYAVGNPGTYMVRVVARGRDSARQSWESGTPGGVPHSTEQYVFSFWRA